MKFPEKYTIDSLKEHMTKIHPNIEIISNNYEDNDSKIIVRCKIHGNIWETTAHRLSQQKFACRKCYDEYRTEIIRKRKRKEFMSFLEKHYSGIYDLSKVNYVNNKTKITLVCPEHGEFLLRPDKIVNRLDGCPFCNESHLERETRITLDKLGIKYEREKTFDWLKNKQNLYLDFYLPDYNIAIECQGEQHIDKRDSSIMNKHDKFDEKVNRDKIKYKLCVGNEIEVIYIFNKKYSTKILDEMFENIYNNSLFIEDIFENNSILLKRIISETLN
jgi:hypothetical protein